MSPRRISSKNRLASLTRARRGCVTRDPGLVLQIRPFEPGQLDEVREIEEAVDLIHLILGGAKPLSKPIQHRRGCGARDLDADHIAEPAAPKLGFHGLEEVVCVVGHLEVGVARDPEDGLLGDLHAGEQ